MNIQKSVFASAFGNLLFAILLLALQPMVLAQEPTQSIDAQRYASAKFDKVSHDFGDIQKGDEAVAVFNVINQGQAPLIIENITASCGCTVAKWNKDPILPQDTTQIRISYNSNIVGEIKRSVVVKTNDKHKMRTLLTITGNDLYVEEE